MKQFLLFAGYDYYPAGGWGDFVDSFDSAEEAEAAADKMRGDWYQVVDTATGQEV